MSFLAIPPVETLADNLTTNWLAGAAAAMQSRDYQTAIKYCNKILEQGTPNPLAYAERSSAYWQSGDSRKAFSDIDEAIRTSTNLIAKAVYYSTRGCYNLRATNYEDAVDDCSQSIELDPTCWSSYVYRADALEKLGRFNQSIYNCNMATMLDPQKAEPYYIKTLALRDLNQVPEAIEACNKAMDLDTNYFSLHYVRGFLYFESEDYRDAIQDFGKAIELNPNIPDAYCSRGLSRSHIGDFKNGIQDCLKGFQLDTNSCNGCNNLAWLLTIAPDAKLRDGNKAVALATRSCELSSWRNAYCIGTLAAANAEVGNFDKAVELERKCILMGLPDKEMRQAHVELNLFEQKKPYHQDKPE